MAALHYGGFELWRLAGAVLMAALY